MSSKSQNKKISILFLANGNGSLGLGHLARCRSLAKGFMIKADCNIFISSAELDMAKKVFAGLKSVKVLKSNQVFAQHQYDIVFADIPGLSLSKQKEIKKKSKVFVYVNDDDVGPFFADIVIRPNVLDLLKPSFLSNGGVCWQGNKYIILDPIYYKAKRWNKKGVSTIRNIFLCFGGSDPLNITATAVALLKKMPFEFKVNVVIGAAYKNLNSLKRIIGKDKKFTLHSNVSNIAGLITKADFAIISGGTLLYEACFLGVPTIVVNQNADQNREADVFEASNAVVNVGIFNKATSDSLNAHIKTLMKNVQFRLGLSKNARLCISSFGTHNIVNAICKHYIWKRS